jgi:hypothetical protein
MFLVFLVFRFSLCSAWCYRERADKKEKIGERSKKSGEELGNGNRKDKKRKGKKNSPSQNKKCFSQLHALRR